MIPGTRSAVISILACVTACSPSEDPTDGNLLEVPGYPSVIFLTQSEAPTDMMDALFDGRIVRDEAGCLRHATEDYTLIWPFGYTLVGDDHGVVVRDADGDTVGRIGERFTLGGGVLLFLHDGLSMTAEARELAERECPGQYWLVGAPVQP